MTRPLDRISRTVAKANNKECSLLFLMFDYRVKPPYLYSLKVYIVDRSIRRNIVLVDV